MEVDFKRRLYSDENLLDQVVKTAFMKVDQDNSGEIDFNEFSLLVLDIAKKGNIEAPSQIEIKSIFDTLDTDKSGSIGYQEFKYLILRILDME